MYVSICAYVHTRKARGVTASCSCSYKKLWAAWQEYWDLNLGPLQEQDELLTTEPFFPAWLISFGDLLPSLTQIKY